MEKYKDFNIGDVYYIPSNDFYVYIFVVDKSNSTRLNNIKILLVILADLLLMD